MITTTTVRTLLPILAFALLLLGCAYPAASWQHVAQQRAEAGIPALEWDTALAAPAQARAEEIARLGALDHSGFQALHDTTIPERVLCEILGRQPLIDPGYGKPLLDSIGWGWTISPRHRECALGADFRRGAMGWAIGPDGTMYLAMWLTR